MERPRPHITHIVPTDIPSTWVMEDAWWLLLSIFHERRGGGLMSTTVRKNCNKTLVRLPPAVAELSETAMYCA